MREVKKTQQVPVETVLERPDLVIGTLTGNIGLMKGEGYVYVRICKVLHQIHRLGVFIPLAKVKRDTMQEYTGPIDDELMANILIYGGVSEAAQGQGRVGPQA